MGFGAKINGNQAGKRAQGRLRVRLHAKLVTLSTTHPAILLDISRRGAKLMVETLPPVGSTLVLHWDRFECFGVLAWAYGGRCGIAFGSNVPEATLIATRDLDEAGHLPEEGWKEEAARSFADGSGRFGFD